MQQRVRYLIYEAWTHILNGNPIPVDIYWDLVDWRISPERLHGVLSEGHSLPLSQDMLEYIQDGLIASQDNND